QTVTALAARASTSPASISPATPDRAPRGRQPSIWELTSRAHTDNPWDGSRYLFCVSRRALATPLTLTVCKRSRPGWRAGSPAKTHRWLCFHHSDDRSPLEQPASPPFWLCFRPIFQL